MATLRVVGEGAAALIAQCFLRSEGRAGGAFPLGRVLYGRWGSPAGEEVVVCRRPVGPAGSGHGEAIEIHCHGGSAAVQAIVQSLVERGAASVLPFQLAEKDARLLGEAGHLGCDHFRMLAGSAYPPAIAREARAALPLAPTLRTAGILLDQWAGALASETAQIGELLSTGQTAEAQRRLRAVLGRSALGGHLTTPWRVVLAGRPNVGKSSLTNALLGYERAIVFDQPGTTRDVVTASAAFDGWPVELTDTAGLRTLEDGAPADALETAGIAKARQQIAAADLLVLVFDAAAPWSADDADLAHRQPAAVRVFNKCDLAGLSDLARPPWLPGLCEDNPLLRTSAVTGAGVAALGRHIAARLVPEPPPAGAAVPFTARQIELLNQALAGARQGPIDAGLRALNMLLGD